MFHCKRNYIFNGSLPFLKIKFVYYHLFSQLYIRYSYLTPIIRAILWFQVFLSNTNNFQITRAQTGTTTPGREDLGLMAIKEYSTFSRFLRVEPHHQIQFSVIARIFVLCMKRELIPLQRMQSAYYKSHRQCVCVRERERERERMMRLLNIYKVLF